MKVDLENIKMEDIESMFDSILSFLQREVPSLEECIQFHLKHLHSHLLLTNDALSIVKQIRECIDRHVLIEEAKKWQEILRAVHDWENGENQNAYSISKLNEGIVKNARQLWHTKISNVRFHEFIGQRVTGIDIDIHFIIQFEKGAVILECPWRLRDKDGIIIGESDVQVNSREWRLVEELLMNKRIEDIHLFEQCPLMILQLDDLFLDIFHASSNFDGWTLTDDEDFYIFSMHGGSVV